MLWKCPVCGLIYKGEYPPEKCPKCGAPKEKFAKLSDEDAEKVIKSERSNDIHMEIITLAERIARLSEEGIEINLDPGCVSDFSYAKEHAEIIKQRCKAEIAIHIGKGKW